MSQERWLVVLRLLDGPLASLGSQTLRGPVVRLGADPGPGGLKLTGYRGLDARHCVISVYDQATAQVTPVGTNQVRMAPHAQVNWREIDPMSGPHFLSKGSVLHLGPIGRGGTIQFVECRRLGQWASGQLVSEGSDLGQMRDLSESALRGTSAPASIQARQTRKIRANTIPVWFIGGAMLMAAVTAASLAAILMVLLAPKVDPLGPEVEGFESYTQVDLAEYIPDPKFKEGMQVPFYDFVIRPNIQVAPDYATRLSGSPENWDQKYYTYTVAATQQITTGWRFFKRIDAVRLHYASVIEDLRRANLPEVLAAIPYHESRYRPDEVSPLCAAGYWQYMLEVAHRLSNNLTNFDVRECRFKDVTSGEFTYTPEHPAPVGHPGKAEYVRSSQAVLESGEAYNKYECRIATGGATSTRLKCARDDRGDLRASTQAAIFTLGEAFNDPEIRASGAATQMTIISHHAGYDDARFNAGKGVNVLPAYKKWKKTHGNPQDWPNFYGLNITVPKFPKEKILFISRASYGGSMFPPNTQHYGYQVTAEHIMAVCYYATNYASEIPAFREWSKYAEEDGYCREFRIPTPRETKSGKFN